MLCLQVNDFFLGLFVVLLVLVLANKGLDQIGLRLGEAIIFGLLLLLRGQEVVNGDEDEHDEFTDDEIVLEIDGD